MDVSSFNDPERRYTWGFEYDGPPLKKGALFVFAHTDIDAVAETEADGSLNLSDRRVSVSRTAEGKPKRYTKRLL